MKKRVLCVLHQSNSSTGQVGIALSQLGHQVETICPLAGQRLSRQIDRFDGLIVFGGPMSANDDHLYGIRNELKIIDHWLHKERPFWGICLGAQMVARVLGSQIKEHPQKLVEIGWYPMNPVGYGKFFFRPLTHVYQWHREGFEIPSGAMQLATGASDGAFSEQAFMVGRHIFATQFHPEMHPRLMNRWLTRAGHMLELEGAQSFADHRSGLLRYYPKQSRWLRRTLDRWLSSQL